MTEACHAPVNGRQGKALADTDQTPTASPVPSKNPQIWRWMAERIFKILSAKWEGEMSKTTLRVNNLPRRFLRFGYRVQTTKSAEASAEAAYPLGERNALLMVLLSKVLLRYF